MVRAPFDAVLSEAQRVLKPRCTGFRQFVRVGTLSELRDGWKAVDGQVHVNRFRELSAYHQLCAGSGLQVKSLHTQPHVLHYLQVRQLTHELKHWARSQP